jgi:hypothetical protein
MHALSAGRVRSGISTLGNARDLQFQRTERAIKIHQVSISRIKEIEKNFMHNQATAQAPATTDCRRMTCAETLPNPDRAPRKKWREIYIFPARQIDPRYFLFLPRLPCHPDASPTPDFYLGFDTGSSFFFFRFIVLGGGP